MSRPQGPIATGRIMSMKNFNDIIGNRTPDQARCSAMPQPTALPSAPTDMTDKSKKLRKPYTCYECQIFPKSAGMLSKRNEALKMWSLSSQTQRGEQKKVHRRKRRFGSERSKCASSTQQIVRFVPFIQLQSEQAFGKCNGLVHKWWRRCHMKHAQRDN
jgi:hypothetical protein